MKQIGLFLVMVVMTLSSFAQSADKQNVNRKNLALKYAEIATEEFNLTEN